MGKGAKIWKTKKGTDAQRHPRQTIGQITGAEFQTKQVKKKIGT